jgi:hypothetical protein
MPTNREQRRRGPPQRARSAHDEQRQLDNRRAEMQAAEGHAGSIPRGNQPAESEVLGHRWWEYQRVLGH